MIIKRIGLHLILTAAAIISLAPLLWVICASFKSGEDLFSYTFLPWSHLNRLSLDAFSTLFNESSFGRWLINSLFLASTQTVIVVTLCSLGGFALAKYRFAGRKPIMAMILGTMLLPWQVLMPSMYELIRHLNWGDSYLAVLVPGAVNAFGLFLFRAAMLKVPDELLWAGRIDGCGELGLWWTIALPLTRPMIAAFTLLSFTASWNSFLWPQIVLHNEAKYTLPIGLFNMNGQADFQTSYNVLMAATVLSVLPVAILFFALQRDFIAGLSSGAVKE